MEEELRQAIRELKEAISELSAKVGRGSSSAGKTGGVNRGGAEKAQADQFEKVSRGMAKLAAINDEHYKQIAEQLKTGKKLSDADNELLRTNKEAKKAVDRLVNATDDATESEKKRKRVTENVNEGLLDFGRGLATGKATLSGAFDSLGNKLKYASEKAKDAGMGSAGLLNMFSKMAASLGFAVGQMYQFAENARELSGMVDLSRVSIGLLTEARLFSALDKSFVKVINDSSGAFRVFGKNTEEAVKNLSDLSRGLRMGSTFVSGSLGKEFAKDFDDAAKATAQLGLTQDEQASLQASIMQQVRMRAKSEREAQQMLVRQYADTTKSARDLSNQFGISAKEILKSMEDFKKSTAGRLAGRLKVAGGEEIKTGLQQLMPTLSEDQLNRMALDMARGQYSAAMAAVPKEYQESGQVFVRAIQQAQSMEGGVAKNLGQTTRDLADVFEGIGRSRQEMSSTLLGEMSDAGLYASEFATRLRESDKARAEGEKKTGRTEADNVKTTSDLTGSMDLLRGAVNALTASILGLGAILGPLAITLGGTALTGGFKGAITSLAGVFKNGVRGFADLIKGLGPKLASLADIFKTGISGFSKLFKTFGPKLAGFAGTAASGIGATASTIGTTAGAAGAGILGTLGKYGSKLPAGSMSKALMSGAKGFGIGAIGGLIGDVAADALGRDTKAGATADVAGTAASYAGMGAMIGSIVPGIGTAIGAALGGLGGLGVGLYSNASTLFKPSDTAPPLEPTDQVPAGKESKEEPTKRPEDNQSMQQVMSYLSQISNDIAAIRTNTRGDNATVPVRLG